MTRRKAEERARREEEEQKQAEERKLKEEEEERLGEKERLQKEKEEAEKLQRQVGARAHRNSKNLVPPTML
jgi:hypothetical protein